MQYVQLRAVQAVATHGGFSAAASALGLTQPAISDQVRRLEQDYGCVLFHRRGRTVEPTEFGRRLLAVIQPIFEAERQAAALLSQAAALEFGTLSMVSDAPDLAVSLIAAFRARHPNIGITLAIANADTCLERLHTASVDVAVTAAAAVDARLHAQTLRADTLIALVHKQSDLAARKSVSFSILAKRGMIFREPRSATQRLLAGELQRHAISCTPTLTVDGREAMVEAVAAGLGVGVIAASEYGGRRGVRVLPISDCSVRMVISLLAPREQAASRLIGELFTVARTLERARAAASAPKRAG
ncbi:LysR family transcriptional regulator [Gluconacetobacter aggeris]|uniref:LysR family transcriptional regulator n=1 Tax=Gluconacetobacter aggeris TaxID=1286186 RepID=A0A7W4IR53_9PROT|nr:LysR substrate-binding domain-containing protein [Gluconacetobacter aggeris]MBB2167433.1 LysR family transcriptional regulator [Gluconacetobacter aggeris]